MRGGGNLPLSFCVTPLSRNTCYHVVWMSLMRLDEFECPLCGIIQSLKAKIDKAYPCAGLETFLSAAPALEYVKMFGCDLPLCEINPSRLEGIF